MQAPRSIERFRLWVSVAAASIVVAACGSGRPDASAAARFVDVTERVGLDFDHDRADRDHFMPDSLAAGCALLDYDADGDLDVYIVNGRYENGSVRHPAGANRLYRQEADGSFTDVTEPSGAGDSGYGMGVAAGDIDNDGFVDLYLTNYGPDALYRNNGDGTFTDVTAAAGVDNPRWATSAGFFDYDADGDLDLFVANYVAFEPSVRAVDLAGASEYPGPECCPAEPDVLFRNTGDGTFEDVSRATGISHAIGRGLGVALIDLNEDGRLDIYVANDRENNRAWIQTADGRFVDRAVEMGIAVNLYGAAEASMGVAIGDADGDRRVDLFLTHLYQETNTLYLHTTPDRFEDATIGSGLGQVSIDFTGFGTAMIDYDLDSDLDLLVVNGRVLRSATHPRASIDPHWRPYAEENLLFRNEGRARFEPAPRECGTLCSEIEVSRGLASGDVDDDGAIDLLTTSGDGRVRLYRNTGPGTAHWLTLRVVEHNRDAYGATVLLDAGGTELRRDVLATDSYLSSRDPRVHFGLGGTMRIDRVRVRWVDGTVELFDVRELDRAYRLVRGEGRPASREGRR